MFKLVQTPISIRSERTIERLSPRQKFDRLKKEIESRGFKLRKFHFNAIENGKQTFVVFDGDGMEICELERNFDGYVEARIKALFDIFLEVSIEKRQGGYTFTFRFSDEILTNLIDSETKNREEMMYQIRQYLNNFPVAKMITINRFGKKKIGKELRGKNWQVDATDLEIDEKLFEIRQKFGIFD